MSRILVTGATGKVGSNFVRRILNEPADEGTIIRALCHNRHLEPHVRVEVVTGSISERAVVRQAMQGVTHVVHCATCKETEDLVMDVTVKGHFWLLEECRRSEPSGNEPWCARPCRASRMSSIVLPARKQKIL